jgi:hypothetical protein
MRLLVLAFCLIACDPTPAQGTSKTTNASVQVDLLFEHDGCKAYRFSADGEYHYYVRCKDSTLTSDRRPCGEDCVRTEEIPLTVQGK